MVPLTETPAFVRWVSNTVVLLGGFPIKRLCGFAGLRALTFNETRAAACQEVSGHCCASAQQALALHALIARTNKSAHRTLH